MIKNAKEYLNQARTLNIEINARQAAADNLREMAECLSSPSLSEKVKSSSHNSSMNTVDKIVDLEREINESVNKLVDLQKEILRQIENVEKSIERTVLIERYINVREWEEVARIVGYTERQTLNIHGNALEHFSKFQSIS